MLSGDLDSNGVRDDRDIDLLFLQIGLANHLPPFDLTGDGLVNGADATYLVETILATSFGDINLDRQVDRSDAAILALNFGRAGDSAWARGDFNGDGRTDLFDLVILQQSFAIGQPALAPAAIVAGSCRCSREIGTSGQTTG